jgi:hypothetical protein
LFLNWGGHVLIKFQRHLLYGQPLFETVFLINAIVLFLVIVAMLYWIFVRATTRIQRLWGGVFIWSAVSIIYFILR